MSIPTKIKADEDPTIIGNRRPIAIFPFLRRLYSKAIVKLIMPYVSDSLHLSQRGFQPGRGCVKNIFRLRQTIQLTKSSNRQCVIISFGAKSAFNSVSGAHRSQCLSSLPVPDRLRGAYLNLFDMSDIKVQHGGQITKLMKVLDGVPQGEPSCFSSCLQLMHTFYSSASP